MYMCVGTLMQACVHEVIYNIYSNKYVLLWGKPHHQRVHGFHECPQETVRLQSYNKESPVNS